MLIAHSLLSVLTGEIVLVDRPLSEVRSGRHSHYSCVWTWSRSNLGEGDEPCHSRDYEHDADADMGRRDFPKDREVGGWSGGAS